MIIFAVLRHSDRQTFHESTELTPVPVQADHMTLSLAQTPIFNLLLDGPPKETLATFARSNSVMIATVDKELVSLRIWYS